METNVEILQRLIEAFNREGVSGVLPFFSEDAEVYDPDLPLGTYRGHEGVRKVIEQLMSGFRAVTVKDFQLLPAGDRVVALLHTRFEAERNALELEVRDAHTFTFRDGKVAYWRLYLDRVEALTDAGLDPELATAGSS